MEPLPHRPCHETPYVDVRNLDQLELLVSLA
jgi:hypothetical protein